LEVILAIAIMAGAMVVLGEIARTGARGAEYARDMTQANLLCEDTMAQVLSGVLTPDPVDDSPLDTSDMNDGDWVYSIDQEEGQGQGLLVITVTVKRADADPKHPVSASITRWMLDPNMDWTSLQQNNSGSSSTTSPTNPSP